MSQRHSQGSQRSQSTPKSQASSMSSRELQDATHDLVRYLLMQDFDKHPIRYADISKNVLKAFPRGSSLIIDKAAKILKDVYGLDLIQLETNVKQYILTNSVEHQAHIAYPEEVESQLMLLGIILTFIFMVSGSKKGAVEQPKVHEFLATLDIDVNRNHEYFGKVKEVIELLRSQHYLQLDRMEKTDPPKFEYRWGERAHHEFSLRKALQFASEMCNVDNVEKWSTHYKAVLESEGQL